MGDFERAGAQTKSLRPLAWIGIGCGGLVLIAVVALELVGNDREADTITIPEKESGETVSVKVEDLPQGGVPSGAADSGVSTMGTSADAIDLPVWLPPYPGVLIEQAGYTTVSDERLSGRYSVTTTDSSAEVEAHWLKVMGNLGLKVQWTFLGAHNGHMLSGRSDQYDLTVTISAEGSETSAVVAFEGPLEPI